MFPVEYMYKRALENHNCGVKELRTCHYPHLLVTSLRRDIDNLWSIGMYTQNELILMKAEVERAYLQNPHRNK